MHNKKRRIIKLLITGSIGLGILLVLVYLVINKYIYIPCLFHQITGWYCPGCGITRAVVSLINGDIIRSTQFNILLPILLVLGIYYLIVFSYRYIKTGEMLKLTEFYPRKIILVLLIIALGYGVLRNITGFECLRPV